MMKKKGFTLVEIMIVVLIIGVLLAIAIPQFMSARERSRRRTCMENLRLIESAKDQYSMENALVTGAAVTMGQITPNFLRSIPPTCPGGGSYTVGVVGTNATCTLSGSPENHVLP